MMSKMVALLFALYFACVSAKTCKYDSSGFQSHWRFANNSIMLQFMNTDIKNNHWTGIGFGDDKVRHSVFVNSDFLGIVYVQV